MGKKIVVLAGVIALIVSLSGCVALLGVAAGGAGTAMWLSGKLTNEVGASYLNTVNAAENALKSLRMEINKETATNEVTQIISEYSDGSKVWVDIRPLGQALSKVEIRVGIKGDKAVSSKIMEKIKKSL